jgi:hypothetical protein
MKGKSSLQKNKYTKEYELDLENFKLYLWASNKRRLLVHDFRL